MSKEKEIKQALELANTKLKVAEQALK